MKQALVLLCTETLMFLFIYFDIYFFVYRFRYYVCYIFKGIRGMFSHRGDERQAFWTWTQATQGLWLHHVHVYRTQLSVVTISHVYL